MTTVELFVGDCHTIRLRGLGSAGFAWSATVDDPKVARVTSIGTAAPESSPDSPAPGFSSSRDELFEILALHAGQTVIRCAQTRPWQKHAPPHASSEILFIVRPRP